MRIGLFFALIVLLAFTSGCCKKKVYCQSGSFDFAITGFERHETRSFVLRRIPIDGEWNEVIDSSTFVYVGGAPITKEPDTLYFSDYNTTGDLTRITAGNDWLIYMPSTGQLFPITKIVEEDLRSELVRCNDDGAKCTKAITHFLLFGQWKNGNFTYLEKPE